MINNTDILTEPLICPDFMNGVISDEDLNFKLKQIKEVTNCNEEQGILILHDCNYNIEFAINKILTLNSQTDIEWKTKKGKQKKINLKVKDNEKYDLNAITKDNAALVNNKSLKEERLFAINVMPYINNDSYNNGKTFRNFNLSKNNISGYHINEILEPKQKPSIIDLNFKWDGKSVIIENLNFVPMSSLDVRTKPAEKSIITQNETIKKENIITESSIMFKTHCSTKPPPKFQYSLVSPVQIMNKNITDRPMLKLKFGDTDFSENSAIECKSPTNNQPMSQSSVINVEDNSIIKVGPPQKFYDDQSPKNFAIHQNIYNQNPYFAQKIHNQSCLSNNVKSTDYQKCNSTENYYENFGYINLNNQLPIGNSLSCKTGFPSIGSYVPSNINNIKDISNQSIKTDVFLNQSQSSTYQSQTNINHPKSTIYIVPNVMMNPMNTLYMTVANPLPTSALSPPMAPIQAQYNSQPQLPQHNQIYFDESLSHADETSNRMKRPFNPARQQINKSKKSYRDLPEDLPNLKHSDIARDNFKFLPNYLQNNLSKPVPINYPLYINAQQNRSQLMTNSLTNFPGNFQSQQLDLTSFDNNKKRNMPIQSNNFGGKPWS